MSGEPYTLCPGCERQVDPDESGAIYAVELIRVDTLGGTDYVEGLGAFFHGGHFPHDSVRWRQKPKP